MDTFYLCKFIKQQSNSSAYKTKFSCTSPNSNNQKPINFDHITILHSNTFGTHFCLITISTDSSKYVASKYLVFPNTYIAKLTWSEFNCARKTLDGDFDCVFFSLAIEHGSVLYIYMILRYCWSLQNCQLHVFPK